MPGFQNRSSYILGRVIALPSHTQGGSRMRESRPYGSVRGARDETRVPTATGVDGPLAASECQTGVSKNHQEREPSMSEITTIGLDRAKHVFQVHGIDAQGTTVLRKRLRRGQVLAFFSRIPRCVVGLEACATAHYWARELGALGHEVRLMPAIDCARSISRQRTTPWTAGIGPVSIMPAMASRWRSLSLDGLPGDLPFRRASGPRALKRNTQSRMI